MINTEKYKKRIDEAYNLEDKIDELENFLCEECNFRNQQLKSMFLILTNLNNVIESLKDGKNLSMNRNVLVEKINKSINLFNNLNLEVNSYKAVTDTILKEFKKINDRLDAIEKK